MDTLEIANCPTGCEGEDKMTLHATLKVKGRYDRSVLLIPAGQFPATKEQYHFGRERLVVWEPIPLSGIFPQVAETNPWILPGAYPLRREGTDYRIALRFGKL